MLEHGWVRSNGIRMHYATDGQGPPVLLLHGFPEFWYSWRHQLPALSAAGLAAVAPDLRGYGKSDKPNGVSAYRLRTLLEDIDGLRSALGFERMSVVGHDWGGGLAWSYAAYYPERVDRLAILNCPHPAAMAALLRSSWAQFRRSWYMFAFQIPWLPEALEQWSGYRSIRQELSRTVNPGAMTAADLEAYIDNIRQPGALTAGINYYRAMLRSGPKASAAIPPVQAPTTIIWGEQDHYLMKEGAEESLRYAPAGTRIHYLPQAGHWVQLEQPETVNRLLIGFLRGEQL